MSMDLGVSQADLLEMVVERAAQRIAEDAAESANYADRLHERVGREIERRLAEAVTRVGDEVIAPFVAEGLEKIVIQRTNEWGEQQGKSMTLREFLVQRAEAYLTEEVDYEGQTVADLKARGRYPSDFRRHGTRVAHLVDKHFQFSIEASMKEALANANAVIADGIAGAVKIRLAELAKSFAVKVESKR